MSVEVFCSAISVQLKTGPDLVDITGDFQQLVAESNVTNGTLAANVVGSTGALTTIEYEPGVVQDIKDAIERLAPRGLEYAHELAWHDGNGHSHVQAALLGPSLSIQIREGRLALGTWQQIVCINHDNKSRNRRIEVTVVGIREN